MPEISELDVIKACRAASQDQPALEVLQRSSGKGSLACAYALDSAVRKNLITFDLVYRCMRPTSTGRLLLIRERTD